MEENRIIIDSAPKEATLLAMGGTGQPGGISGRWITEAS